MQRYCYDPKCMLFENQLDLNEEIFRSEKVPKEQESNN